MKLVKVNEKFSKNEVMFKKTKYLCLLDEFLASDLDAAAVEEYTTKSPYSCACAIKRSIKRFGYSGRIEVLVKNRKVILIKTNTIKD